MTGGLGIALLGIAVLLFAVVLALVFSGGGSFALLLGIVGLAIAGVGAMMIESAAAKG